MAEAPNKALRWGVIAVAVLAGIGLFTATLRNSSNQINKPPAQPPAQGAAQTPAPTPGQTPAPGPSPVAPGPEKAPAGPGAATPPGDRAGDQAAAPMAALTAKEVGDGTAVPASIGGVDPSGKAYQKVDFALTGAGVRVVTLARYFTQIDQTDHVELQAERRTLDGRVVTAMGLLGVQLDGVYVDLYRPTVWKEIGPGEFEALVVEKEGGKGVARVVRQYVLTPESYTVQVRQRVENLTGRAVRVEWFQLGTNDMPTEKVTYGGDRRRLKFGYLIDPTSDPARQIVFANDSNLVLEHSQVVGAQKDASGAPLAEAELWPNATSKKRGYELVWLGTTNRYFAAAVLPLIDVSNPKPAKAMSKVRSVDRYLLTGAEREELAPARLNGAAETVAAGGSADFSLGLYVGPQSAQQAAKDPLALAAGLDQVVHFSFGGPCGCCTFAWLTEPLLKLLIILHDHVTHDWGIAIMLLVVIVRTLLHPVTKWTQIRMQRFGKQMQSIAPKMQQIKEKYANDQAKLQAETGKLWKEEGISPVSMLGCMTTFIQTPVWMALSAMLFFAIELRHQHGLYGVFQTLGSPSGAFPYWFLGDLAEPDRFLYFHRTIVTLPLMGEITSFNVLPIFMGVLFYVQQKYISPPQTSATMTPEQETQMKMMKWMTVFMFPLMMYNAPSGLTLYFFTNSLLGILEGKWIKHHIETHDLLNLDKMRAAKKAGPKAGGWMARLQERAEKARQMQEEMQKQQRKSGGPPPDRFGRKR